MSSGDEWSFVPSLDEGSTSLEEDGSTDGSETDHWSYEAEIMSLKSGIEPDKQHYPQLVLQIVHHHHYHIYCKEHPAMNRDEIGKQEDRKKDDQGAGQGSSSLKNKMPPADGSEEVARPPLKRSCRMSDNDIDALES